MGWEIGWGPGTYVQMQPRTKSLRFLKEQAVEPHESQFSNCLFCSGQKVGYVAPNSPRPATRPDLFITNAGHNISVTVGTEPPTWRRNQSKW